MAKIKYTGEEALARVADYVNKKLTFASSMPESPDTNTIVLYVGGNTASYLQGGIYEYDGTNWNLINSVQQIELTKAEYDALPIAVQNNGTIYFITDASLPGSIVEGYYNEADDTFYEEDTFETEIPAQNKVLYIDLDTKKIYIYDIAHEEYAQVGGNGGGGKSDIVPWSSATDEQIAEIINGYYNGVYSLNEIKAVWHVGDQRRMTLSAMPATGVSESHRMQDVYLTILDFDHDELETPINGITNALVSLQTKDCLRAEGISDTDGEHNTENGYMNSTGTNVGGWRDSARRAWCNNICYNAFSNGIKLLIKPVKKISTLGNQTTTLVTTIDYIWFPSEFEITGEKAYLMVQEGTQYEYYKTRNNRYKLPLWVDTSSSARWWERSSNDFAPTNFCIINAKGASDYYYASNLVSIAPACCL